MRAVVLFLVLATVPAVAAPAGADEERERAMPAPVTAPAMVVPTPVVPVDSARVAPRPQPTPASASPRAPVAPTPSCVPGGAAQAPAVAQNGGARAAPPRPAAPPPAVIEKLGQGDRAFLAGDYRAALFAYQDAVYLAPQNAAARVKLGRAYLALRYPAQAIAQAEQALAAEPDDEDARRLLQDARNPPPRPAPTAPAAAEQGEGAPRLVTSEVAKTAQPRVYRFTPEPEEAAPAPKEASAERAAPAVGDGAAAARPSRASADPGGPVAQADAAPSQPGDADADAAASARAAGDHYRTALGLLSRREYPEAIRELSDAIEVNPRLAVAWAARGSAQFGLGRYREASGDYRAALDIDASLATPLYGLAECLRLLGDSKASAEMYQRYADSGAKDVRDDLRTVAARRARELR